MMPSVALQPFLDEEEMIVPGNRRKTRKRLPPRRELFGKRKDTPIEGLSCSCSSARGRRYWSLTAMRL